MSKRLENITQQRQMEMALMQSEEKYRTIFENALIGLFRSRISNGTIIECNNRFAQKLGFKDRESLLAVGTNIDEYFEKEDQEYIMREL